MEELVTFIKVFDGHFGMFVYDCNNSSHIRKRSEITLFFRGFVTRSLASFLFALSASEISKRGLNRVSYELSVSSRSDILSVRLIKQI